MKRFVFHKLWKSMCKCLWIEGGVLCKKNKKCVYVYFFSTSCLFLRSFPFSFALFLACFPLVFFSVLSLVLLSFLHFCTFTTTATTIRI